MGGRARCGQRGPETDTQPPASPSPLFPPPQGRQLESVKAEAAEKGDVGLVAENSRSTQRLMLPPPALTAAGVFTKFRDIARLAGSAVSGAGGQPCAWTLCPSPRGPGATRVARGPSGHTLWDWVASGLLVGQGVSS